MDILEKSDAVFIRTVTHYFIGIVVEYNKRWIALTRASWVADTGRLSEFLAKGTADHTTIEVYPGQGNALISVGAIVDVIPWVHELPTAPPEGDE